MYSDCRGGGLGGERRTGRGTAAAPKPAAAPRPPAAAPAVTKTGSPRIVSVTASRLLRHPLTYTHARAHARTHARTMSTVVDSWDSWLEDQAAPKKRAVASSEGAAGEDTPQVHPVAQLDANAKDEFVKLAAEVEQAQRAAQAGKKSGNKGRKKREREERDPKKVAVPSESFEALKQRLLAQTLEPVTEPATKGGESSAKGAEGGEAKVSKSKLKRQRKKAAAAKKQKQKQNAGKQPTDSDRAVPATNGDSAGDGTASSKVEKTSDDQETATEASAGTEAPNSAPADPMCAIAERYLELWHESNADGNTASKGRWKFKKAVQIWLLQNACYKQRLSGTGFKRFLKSVWPFF